MLRSGFSAAGTERLVKVEGWRNAAKYREALKKNSFRVQETWD